MKVLRLSRIAVRLSSRRRMVSEPGDLVQPDTSDIRPLPGVAVKQFTARDAISKYIIDFVLTNLSAISPLRSALNATYKMKGR